MLAQTLTILALSTPFMSANFMMSRVFYANEDARTPFYVQLLLAVVYVAGAFAIQFMPVGQIIYAIAILYMVGNILSVVISAFFLRRLLGNLDGPRIANAYIRMGYAALGAAIAGAGALWLMGSYSPDGFAWSGRSCRPGDRIVVGPIMLAVYCLPAQDFPRLGTARYAAAPARAAWTRRRGAGRRTAGDPPSSAPRAPPQWKPGRQRSVQRLRATTSVDTGLIPGFRVSLTPCRSGQVRSLSEETSSASITTTTPRGHGRRRLPARERTSPAPRAAGLLRDQIPLPGRRTFRARQARTPISATGAPGKSDVDAVSAPSFSAAGAHPQSARIGEVQGEVVLRGRPPSCRGCRADGLGHPCRKSRKI